MKIGPCANTNLYIETLSFLHECLKNPEDVKYIIFNSGRTDYYTDWENFKTSAEQIDYDAGWGSAEINMSLQIVGDNWWLERHEYDGAEGWDFKTISPKPEKTKRPEIDDFLTYKPLRDYIK